MERITLIKTKDNTIWITSDENELGTEVALGKIKNEDKQMMVALAEFLGYEPSSLLCFDETFTAVIYEDDGMTVEDLSTYDIEEDAIDFARNRGWDEVVNDNTGEVIWRK